jgi:hypothetical protein
MYYFYQAMPTTAMSDYSGQDLMHILKEMADEICDRPVQYSLSGDKDVRDFMTLMCQLVDAGNILTSAELSE